MKMSFVQPVIALLFCSSAKCHKSNDNSFTLCLVVNVQSVTSDYSVLSRMIKPGVLMCVCVFVYVYVFAIPGPALHQGILIVAGSLTEPVRGYSRVFCEFTAHLQYEAQILQMRK